MKDDESCSGCIIRDKAGQIWGRERFSVGIYFSLTGDLTRAEASVFEQGPSLWTSGRKGVTAMVSQPQGSRGQGALKACQGQREHTAERGTFKGNLQMRQDTLKKGEDALPFAARARQACQTPATADPQPPPPPRAPTALLRARLSRDGSPPLPHPPPRQAAPSGCHPGSARAHPGLRRLRC